MTRARRLTTWSLGTLGVLLAVGFGLVWSQGQGELPPALKTLEGVPPAWERPAIERDAIVRTGAVAYWIPKPLREVDEKVREQVIGLPGWQRRRLPGVIMYYRGRRPGTLYGPSIYLSMGRTQKGGSKLDPRSSKPWTTVMVGDHLREPTLRDRVRFFVRRYVPR